VEVLTNTHTHLIPQQALVFQHLHHQLVLLVHLDAVLQTHTHTWTHTHLIPQQALVLQHLHHQLILLVHLDAVLQTLQPPLPVGRPDGAQEDFACMGKRQGTLLWTTLHTKGRCKGHPAHG